MYNFCWGYRKYFWFAKTLRWMNKTEGWEGGLGFGMIEWRFWTSFVTSQKADEEQVKNRGMGQVLKEPEERTHKGESFPLLEVERGNRNWRYRISVFRPRSKKVCDVELSYIELNHIGWRWLTDKINSFYTAFALISCKIVTLGFSIFIILLKTSLKAFLEFPECPEHFYFFL